MTDAGISRGRHSPNLPQPRGRMHARGGEFEVHPSAYFVRDATVAGDPAMSGELVNFYSGLLRKLWRRKLLIAVVALLGTGVGIAVVLRMPAYYAAHAFVVIGDQSAKALPIYNQQQGGVRSTLPDSTGVQTEVEIIKSPQLVTEVVRDLKLQEKPEFNPAASSWFEERLSGWVKDWLSSPLIDSDPQERGVDPQEGVALSQTIDNVRSRLRVSIKQNSRMIDIEFESVTPRLAMQIANAIADRYIANQLELRSQAAFRAKMEEAETAAEESRARAGLFSTPDGSPFLLRKISDMTADLANAQTARAAIEARLGQLRASSQSKARPVPMAALIDSPLMKTLDGQEAEAQQKLAEASASLGDKHPTAIGLRDALARIQAAKRTEAARTASSLENDLKVAQLKERDLSDRLSRLQQEVTEVNRAQIKLRSAEREALAQRPDAQIVSYAQLPARPDRPKKGLLIAIAAAGSLIGGALLALLVERADRSMHSLAEVEDELGVAVLGVLPTSKGAQLSPCEAARYGSSYREAMKATYSRLLCKARAPKVTVVTSALPGEGKTTFALSMAAMAAQSGLRVVLIDADYWRRGAAAALGMRSRAGLAELLEGRAKLADAVTCDVASGADIILAGTFSRASLLAWARKLPELLLLLKKQYDVVIIDAPPVLGVSEAPLIASHADATVMAIRSESTSRDAVRSALRDLHDAEAVVAGAVLTLVRETRQTYYGYPAHTAQSLADNRRPAVAIAAEKRPRLDDDTRAGENRSPRQALLIMDVPGLFTASSGRYAPSSDASERLSETIDRLSQLASKFGITMIYAERELVPARLLRLLTKRSDGDPTLRMRLDRRLRAMAWYSFVRPGRDAFSNSDLDEVLREHNIRHIFLAGLDGATSVAQTARSALELGYRVTFVQDGIFTAFEDRWGRLLKDFESDAAFAITSDEFAEFAETAHKASQVQKLRTQQHA